MSLIFFMYDVFLKYRHFTDLKEYSIFFYVSYICILFHGKKNILVFFLEK